MKPELLYFTTLTKQRKFPTDVFFLEFHRVVRSNPRIFPISHILRYRERTTELFPCARIKATDSSHKGLTSCRSFLFFFCMCQTGCMRTGFLFARERCHKLLLIDLCPEHTSNFQIDAIRRFVRSFQVK